MAGLSRRIIKYRGLIVTVSVALTLLAALMLPRLEISPSLDEYVPDHLGNKTYLKELNEIFSGSKMIHRMGSAPDVVNASTIGRLKAMAGELSKLEGIERVVSPFDLSTNLL